MSIDRLDGTAKGGCLFELFTMPGRVILWFQYMNPSTKPGRRGMIAQTKRRANSPVMSVLYSLAFWAITGFCVYAFLTVPTQKPVPQSIPIHYNTHTHLNMIDIEDEDQKLDMLNIIKEISAELSKMDDSRDQIKEIIGAAAEAFTLPKPLIRKVARLYHKKNVADFENETSDIKNLYKAITVV